MEADPGSSRATSENVFLKPFLNANLRDPVSWQPLTVDASSHNLAFTIFDIYCKFSSISITQQTCAYIIHGSDLTNKLPFYPTSASSLSFFWCQNCKVFFSPPGGAEKPTDVWVAVCPQG